MLAQGAEIEGHVVVRPLGRGGMGAVYLIRRVSDDRPFALKLPGSLLPGAREAEADCLRRVDHPSVPRLIRELDDGIVTELVDGPTLGELLRAGRLSPSAVDLLAAELFEVVGAVHAAGLVHRDLSPDNVLITPEAPHVHLVDFGVALHLGQARPGPRRAASPVGSPGYLAPEQATHPDEVDVRADVWSLGALLYALATGRAAFPQTDPDDRQRAAAEGQLDDPITLDASLPARVVGALRAALHPDPDQRPPDVAALAARWAAPPAALDAELRARLQALRPSQRWAEGEGDDPPIAPEPGAGTKLGRYTLVARIGGGAMGVVWRAWDPATEREVALKILRPATRGRATALLRFQREVRALARLEHPRVVRVLDADLGAERVWFAMELIEGPDLAARIARDGPLNWREAAGLGADLADALAHAHAHGLVHRDLKPHNVLCGPRGAALTDFGVVLDLHADTALTATDQLLGTPLWMAPEQVVDTARVGVATDIYGLGAILYTALSGAPPREGREVEVLQALMSPSPPPELPTRIPADLRRVVGRAMDWDAARRYASAAELAEDLRRCLRGEPVRATPPGPWRRLGWWTRRNRVAVATLLGAAAVLGVVGVARLAGQRWTARAREQTAQAQVDVALAATGAQAEAGVADVLALPEVIGTRAGARGWLTLARRRAPDHDAQMEALAHAFLEAPDPDIQLEAILRMADANATDRAAPHRSELAAVMDEQIPNATENPGAKRLLWEGAVEHHDLARAAELAPDDPSLPALRALSRGTRTGVSSAGYVRPRRWRGHAVLDVMGNAELGQTSRVVSLEDPRLPTIAEATPYMADLVTSPSGDDLQIIQRDGRLQIVDDDGVSRVDLGPGPPQRAVSTAADLDGDGQVEVYLGLGRRLLQIHYQDGLPVSYSEPHPETDGARSDIDSLYSADLDGDGRPELVAGLGPWWAFDVRVYGWREGALRLLGRQKTGNVEHVFPAPDPRGGPPLVGAVTNPYYANRLVFPPEAPLGTHPGLALFRWTGTTLSPVYEADLPVRAWAETADINGDGTPEILASSARGLLVLSREGGQWRGATLGELYPLAVVDADHDGDDDLIAEADGKLWTLGAGDEPLPLIPTRAERYPPMHIAGPLGSQVERARVLAELGFERLAAERLPRLADLLGRGPDAGATWRLAARLDQALGRGEEAANADLSAANADPGVALAALADAVQGLLDARRFTEAAQVQDRLVAAGGAPIAPDLPALAAHATETVDLDLSSSLDPRWAVDSPTGLIRDRDGLRIRAHASATPLARLPLRWQGGPVTLELDGEKRWMDWAGVLWVGLGPTGEPAATGFELTRTGGARVYEDTFACLWMQTGMHLLQAPWSLEARYWPGHGNLCYARQDGAAPLVYGLPGGPAKNTDDRWELEIRIGSMEPLDEDALPWVDVLLTRLRLTGVALEGGSPAPDATHALADGRPELALQRLSGRHQPGDLLARAVALQRLGMSGADEALRSALRDGDPATLAELSGLVRQDPDVWVPMLSALQGRAVYATIHRAWSLAIEQHPDEPGLLRFARTRLGGLKRLPPGLSRQELRLLMARGRAWVTEGQWSLAEGTLRRCRDEAARLADTQERQALLGEIGLLEAQGAAVTGDPDLAFTAIRRALRDAPDPAVAADILTQDPAFAALRERDAWAAVVGPALARGERPAEPARRGSP